MMINNLPAIPLSLRSSLRKVGWNEIVINIDLGTSNTTKIFLLYKKFQKSWNEIIMNIDLGTSNTTEILLFSKKFLFITQS